jgi:hypothetical protein
LGGVVGFLVRNDINSIITEVTDNAVETNMEILCIKVRCKIYIYIAVTYGLQESSKKEDVERQFQNLATDTIRNRNEHTIILGDLNAKIKLNKVNCIQQKS